MKHLSLFVALLATWTCHVSGQIWSITPTAGSGFSSCTMGNTQTNCGTQMKTNLKAAIDAVDCNYITMRVFVCDQSNFSGNGTLKVVENCSNVIYTQTFTPATGNVILASFVGHGVAPNQTKTFKVYIDFANGDTWCIEPDIIVSANGSGVGFGSNIGNCMTSSNQVLTSAMYRVDGGPWQNSTTTTSNLSNTTHTIDFSYVPGYITPSSIQKYICANVTYDIRGIYYLGSSSNYTSLPAVGTPTNCPSTSSIFRDCCEAPNLQFDAGIIQAELTQVRDDSLFFNIAKCNGTFSQAGTVFIKNSSVCGDVLGSKTYPANVSSIELGVKNLVSDGKMEFWATASSSLSGRYYAEPIIVQNNTLGQDFVLDPILCHLRWPFRESSHALRNGWFGADESSGAGNSVGAGGHTFGDYYAIDWNNTQFLSDCNEPFLSPLAGTVYVEYGSCSASCGNTTNCGSHLYGNNVIIISSINPTYAFRVAHLNSLCVATGDHVNIGSQLGIIGNTGNSYGSHAHCATYKNLNGSTNYPFGGSPWGGSSGQPANNYAVAFKFDAVRGGEEDSGGGSTSISDKLSNLVKIYPNPSNGLFNIESNENLSIEVLNCLGEVIIHQEITESIIELDLSKYSSGIYIVKAKALNGDVSNYKLVKN